LSGFEDTLEEDTGALTSPNLELLASARILDAASQPGTNVEDADKHLLAIDSALCYAMGGNFPSASAKIGALLEQGRTDEQVQAFLGEYGAVCSVIAPSLTPQLLVLVRERMTAVTLSFVAKMRSFLPSGTDEAFNQVVEAWHQSLANSWDNTHLVSALMGCRPVLNQLKSLNLRRVLEGFDEVLPTGFVDTITTQGRTLLLPPPTYSFERPRFP